MKRIQGPWKVTDTVHNERKNLFSLGPRNECHIATIISGSLTEKDRFESYLQIIEASPDMVTALRETLDLLDDYAFIQSPRAQLAAQNIRSLLGRIGAVG